MKVGIEVKYGSSRYLTTNYPAEEGYISAVDLEGYVGSTCQLPIDELTVIEKDNVLVSTFHQDSEALYKLGQKVVEEIVAQHPKGWQQDAAKSIAGLTSYKLLAAIEKQHFDKTSPVD